MFQMRNENCQDTVTGLESGLHLQSQEMNPASFRLQISSLDGIAEVCRNTSEGNNGGRMRRGVPWVLYYFWGVYLLLLFRTFSS